MLPYLKRYGWDAEVIAVSPDYVEVYSMDNLFLETIPPDLKVHFIKAFPAVFTRKFGLGNLSLRGFWHMLRKGNQLLKNDKFDLVFFSTTAFNFMALGPYWKRKFGIPFIVDIQDPWRNDYYLSQPKSKRPPKFFIAHGIDKYLERITIPKATGIISVSPDYLKIFKSRYKPLNTPTTVIPFAGYKPDLEIASKLTDEKLSISFDKSYINIVYIGRGGHDLEYSLSIFFLALQKGITMNPEVFKKVRCWFIGTSYAPQGQGKKTIEPIAARFSVRDYVTEIPDRLPYFETLAVLNRADILFVPGSMDKGYTASKIYPYILSEKPLLACFHINSTVIEVLKTSPLAQLVSFETTDVLQEYLVADMFKKLTSLIRMKGQKCGYNQLEFETYTANSMTRNVVHFFEECLLKDHLN
jgi:hypothetical protein